MPSIRYQPDPRYIKRLADSLPCDELRAMAVTHDRRAWKWLAILVLFLSAGLVWVFTHLGQQDISDHLGRPLIYFGPAAVIALIVTRHLAKSEQYELARDIKCSKSG